MYKNVGARFPREDGSWIERGEVFAPTDAELAQRGFKLRHWNPDPSEVTKEAAPALQDDEEQRVWGLKMEPERYLELYPDGPNADLARKVLDAED